MAALPAKSSECGFDKEHACKVSSGTYYAVAPQVISEKPRPAVFFFHGGGGWGTRIFTSRSFITNAFLQRGYVVIAPNGKKRPGSRFGPGWAFIPQFKPHRNDLAFTREIIADAKKRFNIDENRILITGYSIGGSLVSYLACQNPKLAAAFAPIAGGFWRPHPKECAGPVKLLHTHGWRDQTVPLEGRPLGKVPGGLVHQGDIFATLNQWRLENECVKVRPDRFITTGPFWRRIWTHCSDKSALELALHPGGHEVPEHWPELVIEWFESVTANEDENG